MAVQKETKFKKTVEQGYAFTGEAIPLGGSMLDNQVLSGLTVSIPVKTLNRHGLIAGATGSGKTKSLQLLAEELSIRGIPSLLMDLKGDLSGLAQPGAANEAINKRHAEIGIPFEPRSNPVEFLSLSKQKGSRLRATVSEFGPVLLAKILGLNDTQEGILAVLFKFCDDNGLLLLDLKDLKKALHFASNEGKGEFEAQYGKVSGASVGTILRKIVALEQQGADTFFGERSFDVEDLTGFDENGYGTVSIIRLNDLQGKPDLFSTFMLQLLAEVYEKFPEEGDLERPKLLIFIDEAHLVFQGASKALLEQIETIIKLIRSKGVGIVFCTQNPDDIPAPVLSQLGFKIQHALRAFTARDRKAIKRSAENFPLTDFYQTDQLLTEMGIGEALVTVLNEKGKPTPPVHTKLRAPSSRMGVLTAAEIDGVVATSRLVAKYNEKVDRPSAYELLSERTDALAAAGTPATGGRGAKKGDDSTMEKIVNSTIARQVGRTVARELTRGLLGVFGPGRRRR